MKHTDTLVDIFLAKNEQINLSAIRDAQGVRVKHIQDSLELTKIVDLAKYRTLIDVGTGGGFPLLALALYAQEHGRDLNLTGLDARKKKIKAIQDMCEDLQLENVDTVWSRAEDHRKKYDILTARAVAHADTLFARIVPLVKKDGLIVLYKEKKSAERAEIMKQSRKYKLSLVQEHDYQLFEGDIQRVLYVLRK